MATAKKVYRFPKTMGTCADKLYALKEKKSAAKKVFDEIEAEEKALKAYIIDNLPKSEASGISGKTARVTVVTKSIPQVQDWDKFYKYVARTKAFDMLQRRLSAKAVEERWDNKKKVPGVGTFDVVTVSMNKL